MWSLVRNPNYWRNKFPGVLMLGTTGIVQGTVFDSGGSTPVPGAIVRMCPAGRQTVSKADGTFYMEDVPIGTYHIIAYTDTVQDADDIEVDTDATTSVTFSLTSPFSGCP